MNKEFDFNYEEKRPISKFTPEQMRDGLLRLSAMREAIKNCKERRDREENENKGLLNL